MPALAGVENANRVARKWHEDARLYSIASLTPDVDARGLSAGWLYSYVSVSAKDVVLISVKSGKAGISQKPPVPKSQIELIGSHALPPPGELIDSPEAMNRTKKVKKAIQQNPDARVSAGLDSFSSEEPIWILTTISKGGKRVEERVTATS
jgi:hypothetical protein